MLEIFLQNGVWVWATIGALLLVAELLTGTTYMLWIGVAAFITAIIVAIFPHLGTTINIILFSVIAVASVLGGRKFFPPPKPTIEGDINNPNDRLIGQNVIALEDFVGGFGAVNHGDTRWRAQANDAIKKGAMLRITAIDGATLMVEAV